VDLEAFELVLLRKLQDATSYPEEMLQRDAAGTHAQLP
jgi:hypothetical protein